jgi:CBS domain-containing protein
MTRNPDRVAHTDTVNEVDRRMRNLLVAFLPVCGERDELHGIIALTDLQRVVGGEPAGVTADSLAADPPVTVAMDAPADHLSHLMAQHRVWLLPVLDGRRLVGVIHYPAQLDAARPQHAGLRSR